MHLFICYLHINIYEFFFMQISLTSSRLMRGWQNYARWKIALSSTRYPDIILSISFLMYYSYKGVFITVWFVEKINVKITYVHVSKYFKTYLQRQDINSNYIFWVILLGLNRYFVHYCNKKIFLFWKPILAPNIAKSWTTHLAHCMCFYLKILFSAKCRQYFPKYCKLIGCC